MISLIFLLTNTCGEHNRCCVAITHQNYHQRKSSIPYKSENQTDSYDLSLSVSLSMEDKQRGKEIWATKKIRVRERSRENELKKKKIEKNI
jgi:hypothetical protein